MSDLPLAFVERRLADRIGPRALPSRIDEVLSDADERLLTVTPRRRYFRLRALAHFAAAVAVPLAVRLTLGFDAFAFTIPLAITLCVRAARWWRAGKISRYVAADTRLVALMPDDRYWFGLRAYLVLLPRLIERRWERDAFDRLAGTSTLWVRHRDPHGNVEELRLPAIVDALGTERALAELTDAAPAMGDYRSAGSARATGREDRPPV
jgi:hypothetical protein